MAKVFGVVEPTIRAWIREGRVKAVSNGKGWLVSKPALEKMALEGVEPRGTYDNMRRRDSRCR